MVYISVLMLVYLIWDRCFGSFCSPPFTIEMPSTLLLLCACCWVVVVTLCVLKIQVIIPMATPLKWQWWTTRRRWWTHASISLVPIPGTYMQGRTKHTDKMDWKGDSCCGAVVNIIRLEMDHYFYDQSVVHFIVKKCLLENSTKQQPAQCPHKTQAYAKKEQNQ